MKTVVLKTCAHPVEANLIKTKLESEGIFCFLVNENFSNLFPNFFTMLGSGVKVVVNINDHKDALRIIESAVEKPECPNCGSKNYKVRSKAWWWILISLLIFIPFGNLVKDYKCRDCGTYFH